MEAPSARSLSVNSTRSATGSHLRNIISNRGLQRHRDGPNVVLIPQVPLYPTGFCAMLEHLDYVNSPCSASECFKTNFAEMPPALQDSRCIKLGCPCWAASA